MKKAAICEPEFAFKLVQNFISFIQCLVAYDSVAKEGTYISYVRKDYSNPSLDFLSISTQKL
jgi:hypothetical protein